MIRPARSNSLASVIFAVATISAFCINALAQEAARPDRGTAMNRSYAISDIENINLQNGNVNLTIPLAELPPIAGGNLSMTAVARYDSKLWDVLRYQEDAADLQWAPYVVDMPGTGGGWGIGGGQYSIYFRNANEEFQRSWYDQNSGLPQWELDLLNNFQWWKVVLISPDGSEHELRPIDNGADSYSGSQDFLRGFYKVKPNGSPMRYYSLDGSYFFAKISSTLDFTVYLTDGTKVIQTPDGVQRIQDTNGNKIKMFTDTQGAHIQDEQTGRELKITYDPAANGGQGQYRVWYPTVTGIEHHIDINMGTTTVQGKTYPVNTWDQVGEMVCQRTAGLSATQLQVVREIIFPQTEPGQQRKFVFSYNSDTTETTSTNVNWSCFSNDPYTRTASIGWGELSRVITPPGTIQSAAYSDYTYNLDGLHSLTASTDELAYQGIVQKKLYHDGISDTWAYAISENGSLVTSPDGSWTEELKYCATFGVPTCSTNKAGLAYRTTRPFERKEKHWINLVFSGGDNIGPGGFYGPFNPVVDFEYTTLLDASNNPLKMSAKAFQHDYNGNVTQIKEYDWFDPGLVSRDAQGVPTGIPASATLLSTTNHSHYNQAAGATSANVYAKRSISTGAPLILNAMQQTTVGPGIEQFSYDGQNYGVAPTVGNLTTEKVWVDLESKWITTSNTYDLYGNVLTSTDGRGKITQFFYDDSTHALPTRVVVDPQNGTGAQTTTTVYDQSTGLIISQTDVNGADSTIDYTNQLLGTVDPFGRPGITISPQVNINGTNHRRRVTTKYFDSARQVIVESDLNGENDKLLKTRATSDMLGRPVLTESTEDGTNYTIAVRNAYLNMGQVTLTSSPMRSTASSTDSWTRVTKDNAGRVTEVATFGGATQPAWTGTAGAVTGVVTTGYIANFTTVTDQAGKVRRSMTDPLDRLTRVDEPDASGNLGSTDTPVQATSYTYNVFDNLTMVTQGSQTPRTFTYDSLSRLRSAVNPESGTIQYKYDDNGNVEVKKDARGVSTHYEYDSLNRLKRRWYNSSDEISATTHNSPALPSGVAATDEVKFYYDTQTIPGNPPSYSRGSAIGRLVAQTYGTGSNGDYYAYDVLGRPTLKFQQTGSVNFDLVATYTLSGAMKTLTYHSDHAITNTFDQAGRLTGFTGNLGDGVTRTYATGNVYSPVGGLLTEQFGTNTPVYHKVHYNSRQQICDVRASNVNDEWGGELGALVNYYSTPYEHCVSGSNNNGNLLMSQTIINTVYFEQRYDYDSLNRLTKVSEYQNGPTLTGFQEYDYDRWGNSNIKPASTLGSNKQFTVLANNRLGVPAGQSGVMSYDDAGNLTNDTYTGAGYRTYDAENKITSARGNNNQDQFYKYDASGQRIKRTVDGVEAVQVYGFGGELLAEYEVNGGVPTLQKEYGYRNGQLLITAEAGTTATNVASAANGATATASSTFVNPPYSYPVSAVINGDRKGLNAGNGGNWAGATFTFPQWVEVTFNGSKTINEIDVFTLQDNYANPVEPTEATTFSLYGVTGFDAQYWNGSAWVTVPGGSVTGNNKVWKRLTFAPLTTTKIRVVTNASTDGLSRLVEIEAWTSTSANINWLVSDHLGTPRMIIDQTGTLANVKRHDYLPFGEELFAPTGGRTSQLGYGSGDGVRQQFTAKERDIETGLDYFLARYYSSAQGRFTSPDEFSGGPDEYYDFKDLAADNPTFYADLTDPQSLNKYQYAYNNPLLYIDPDGHQGVREWFRSAANKAADFAEGVGRGISASVSFGASGAPRASDSLVNRAGQGVGTMATAAGGYALFNAGGGATVLSGGSLAKVGIAASAVGVTVVVGATINAAKIATTPMQRNSSGSGGGGYSKKDVERMREGKAPKGNDGHSKELHHPNQDTKKPLKEMTRTEHRGKGNYTKNHPFGNRRESRIDRQKFRKEREDYWKKKAKDMEMK